ncbi:hypothetical protein FKM82_004526 [Ascaphus truei]
MCLLAHKWIYVPTYVHISYVQQLQVDWFVSWIAYSHIVPLRGLLCIVWLLIASSQYFTYLYSYFYIYSYSCVTVYLSSSENTHLFIH